MYTDTTMIAKKMVIKEKNKDYIPDLPKRLFKDLARYLANADDANESMENMRSLCEMSGLLCNEADAEESSYFRVP